MTQQDFFDGVDTHGPSHITAVNEMFRGLSDLHIVKEREYGGSWARRGLLGAWFTMVRPYDRLDNLFGNPREDLVERTLSRAIFDAFLDTALYFVKMAAIIAAKRPDVLRSWLEENFTTDASTYLASVSDLRIGGAPLFVETAERIVNNSETNSSIIIGSTDGQSRE